MKIERYAPSDILKPFIRAFMTIESENGMVNRVLPDTSIVMAFRYRGTVAYAEEGIAASVLTGIRKSSRLIDYSKDAGTLLIQFNEAGAAAFFRESFNEFYGKSLPLDNLVRRHKLDEIEEQFSEAENNRRRISIIERFLLSELKEPRPDRLILNAVQKIKLANGEVRIKDLLTDLPVSRDPFEKRFRRAIGTSPKQFAKIVRLRNLIGKFSRSTRLTEAALTAGYFDQAHFIKDFKAFTKQTPTEFFKSSPFW